MMKNEFWDAKSLVYESLDIRELFVLLEEIEQRLVEGGEAGWADRLRQAVGTSLTLREALDRVCREVAELRRTNLPYRTETVDVVNQIHVYLDRTLPSI